MAHAWRSLLFGIDGWRHYLRSGYEARAKHFDDAPFRRDLTGVHALVTGANQGIGYATAKQLASQRADVHMVCRSRDRGEAAVARLREELGPDGCGALHLHVCDVSSMAAVKSLVDAYVDGGKPLHVLVNNAGCMVHSRTTTSEGVEANFATNVLGTWALTEGLLPALRRAGGDARVVTVSSAGMLTERLELDDPEMRRGTFDGTRQYAKNKRLQVAMTERWARTHGESVGFYAMHPGWSDTAAVRVALPGFYESLKGKLREPWQGADTVAWLCVAPRASLEAGAFYLDRQPVPKHVSTSFLCGTKYKDEQVDHLVKMLEDRLKAVTRERSGETPR